MNNAVEVRQTMQGRKVAILLTPESLERLQNYQEIQLIDGPDTAWEDDLEMENLQEEPLALIEVTIQIVKEIPNPFRS